MNIFWSDAKEIKADGKEVKTDMKEAKAMLKDVVDKLGVDNCLYSFDLVAIFCRCSHTVTGEEVLQKLKGWLSPLDPSTNYNIGLRDLHVETTTWFLESRIFQEWNTDGSLLWIHGKRTFLDTLRLHVPDGSRHSSRFGEERPLVSHSMTSPYTKS